MKDCAHAIIAPAHDAGQRAPRTDRQAVRRVMSASGRLRAPADFLLPFRFDRAAAKSPVAVTQLSAEGMTSYVS